MTIRFGYGIRMSMQSPVKHLWGPTVAWSGNIKRVLVVEDSPDQALMLKDYLESYFYNVRVASNGVEALRAIMEEDHDVILCDVVMPNMAGDMFYYAVQRVKPELCERIIFITGHQENPRVKEFLNRVGGSVLMKPFHLDDVLEMILLLFRELENPPPKLSLPDELVAVTLLQPAFDMRNAVSAP